MNGKAWLMTASYKKIAKVTLRTPSLFIFLSHMITTCVLVNVLLKFNIINKYFLLRRTRSHENVWALSLEGREGLEVFFFLKVRNIWNIGPVLGLSYKGKETSL